MDNYFSALHKMSPLNHILKFTPCNNPVLLLKSVTPINVLFRSSQFLHNNGFDIGLSELHFTQIIFDIFRYMMQQKRILVKKQQVL